MSRRRHRQPTEEPGQDSFLDIIANLVGILIILVMVVGARAKDAMIEAVPQIHSDDIDVDTPRKAASGLQFSIDQLQGRLQQQEFEILFRKKERDKTLQVIAGIERELEERKAGLGQQEQRRLAQQTKLNRAKQRLADLKRSQDVVARIQQSPTVIRHLPTPMAKTVFGKEVHFRLLDGKITFVPWDTLVERLQAEAPQKLWKLKDSPKITETIGPIEGFRMQYTLVRKEKTSETAAGPMVRKSVELDRFSLLPTSDRLGETVEEALLPGSNFMGELAERHPEQTTLTIWVYPNSFNEFRLIKERMYAMGYLTASRPIPAGEKIGGSPRGSRSAAQ